MSPSAIVAAAQRRGLNALALTDHNSALNCPPFYNLCKKAGLACLTGIEVTTQEEAHVLALFDDIDTTMAFYEIIHQALMPIPNNPEKFGDQVYVNEEEEIEGIEDILLIGATSLTIDDVMQLTVEHNGLFIPAHVDRTAFSIPSQLGFLPPAPYSAVEVTRYYPLAEDPLKLRDKYFVLTSSDAHYLEHVGRAQNEWELPDFSVATLRQFFSNPLNATHC